MMLRNKVKDHHICLFFLKYFFSVFEILQSWGFCYFSRREQKSQELVCAISTNQEGGPSDDCLQIALICAFDKGQ